MAKKSKKSIKLNNKIRQYLGDLGFESGITLVETSVLMELVQSLGIMLEDDSREGIIRVLRQVYSFANVDEREIIAEFFVQHGKRYKAENNQVSQNQKSDILSVIAEELELSKEDFNRLLIEFKDTKARKITKERVLSKLEHIAYLKKREALESLLKGSFDYQDRFEFTHAFTYELFGETFSKIHTLHTKVFHHNDLKAFTQETLQEELQKAKDVAVEHFKQRLEKFLHLLTHNRYLSQEEMITALKRSSAESELYYTPLDSEIIKHIVLQEYPIDHLSINGNELLLYSSAEVNIADRSLKVDVDTHLDYQHLIKSIWSSQPLHVKQEVERSVLTYQTDANEHFALIKLECQDIKAMSGLSEETLDEEIITALNASMYDSLHVSRKSIKKIIRTIHLKYQDVIAKRQKEQFLAKTIRDFKNLFPVARSLRREIILHIGPTNSGKTYSAFEALKKADTGYYLAPLRLLALEGYENLLSSGVDASLITGEEQIIDEDATHISSTIEMMNFDVDVDVCVIDEAQMLDDRDRGWAWANAIIGAPAKKVILTGSINVKSALEALCEYLGEPLSVVEFERKNPLVLMQQHTPLDKIQPGSAIVAFSRRDVLRLRSQLSNRYRVSVIYGSLSPEVRREEARRFREGESDVMVATDAIAMGLNLPIQTILFYRSDKFDGENRRTLYPSEIHQISGRAGRYGLREKGYVGALEKGVLRDISKNFSKAARQIKIPFNVMANLEHINLVGTILEEQSLVKILEFFVENMKFTGPFRAKNLEGMLEAAKIVDRYHLTLDAKYHLSVAPISTSSEYVLQAYENYVRLLAADKVVLYNQVETLPHFAENMNELQMAEDMIKEISLYLWLSYRFEEKFIDTQKALISRSKINAFIEASLKNSHFIPKCRLCSKTLPINSEYGICNSCFRLQHRTKEHTPRTFHKKVTKR